MCLHPVLFCGNDSGWKKCRIHAESFTISMELLPEYSNDRENSLLSQDFLKALELLLQSAYSCVLQNADTSVLACVSRASSWWLTPSRRLKIALMMLLFILPEAFPRSCRWVHPQIEEQAMKNNDVLG